jgi:hypothetical protein
MIRKNAESGPEQISDLRRESKRSHLAKLLGPKAGGDVIWDVGGYLEGVLDLFSKSECNDRAEREWERRTPTLLGALPPPRGHPPV